MTEFFDLIIQNGTVLTPAGRQQIDVGVLAGRILNPGHFKASRAAEVIDATGLYVLARGDRQAGAFPGTGA